MAESKKKKLNNLSMYYLLCLFRPADLIDKSERLDSTLLILPLFAVSRTHVPLKALTGLVRSLNSDVKAFETVNSM